MEDYQTLLLERNLQEECGLFGLVSRHTGTKPAFDTYSALYALQHRGQTSAGIAVSDGEDITFKKGDGLVADVFDVKTLETLRGGMSIGHVRYADRTGTSGVNAQPIMVNSRESHYALAFNGKLTNARGLRDGIEARGGIFQTTGDAEVILYVIIQELLKTGNLEQAVANSMRLLKGAYSFLVMNGGKVVAARDPNGFRPLCIGKREDATIFASESCALDATGASFVRDIQPGEIVVATPDGRMESIATGILAKQSLCVFEFVYFARPDSVIDGVSVEMARQASGRCLFRADTVKADVVIGVPDSGLSAAIGYAAEAKLHYQNGFVKNRYIGRTFIQATQGERVSSLQIKLNALRAVVEGKRVVMVDDSIVRGTTIDRVVSILRGAGAKEVHMRVASPPFRHPCYFGTDIPKREGLFANKHKPEEMAGAIGADSLMFLSTNDFKTVLEGIGVQWCDACFTGVYPIQESSIDRAELL